MGKETDFNDLDSKYLAIFVRKQLSMWLETKGAFESVFDYDFSKLFANFLLF